MTHWRYMFAGLLFESELRLPEWSAFACTADEEPDVRVTLDENGGMHPVANARPSSRPDEYRFAVPGIGRYRVLGGSRILVAPDPGATDGEVRLFLLGSALAALCCRRGLLLLHASVVRLTGRTLAFCGAAGAGKSTLAAALIRRAGAAFVSDDLARFDVANDGPIVYPSAPRVKLSPEALTALDWPSDGLDRVHPKAVKFHVPQKHDDPWSAVPLHGIYLLEWGDGPVQVTPLKGLAALHGLVAAATYRPGLLEPLERLGSHWWQCMALAAGVPIYRLSWPREWNATDGAVDILRSGPAIDRR